MSSTRYSCTRFLQVKRTMRGSALGRIRFGKHEYSNTCFITAESSSASYIAHRHGIVSTACHRRIILQSTTSFVVLCGPGDQSRGFLLTRARCRSLLGQVLVGPIAEGRVLGRFALAEPCRAIAVRRNRPLHRHELCTLVRACIGRFRQSLL